MRTLFVVRHGESPFPAGTDDHARPLTPRGELCARELGLMLTRLGEAPEQVISSDARRAVETARAALAAGGWGAEPHLDRTLYLAPPADLTAAVRAARADVRRIMVVAHQPGLSQWVADLTGAEAPAFAPASVARVDLAAGGWGSLGPGSGTLRWVVGPGEAAGFMGPPGAESPFEPR